MLALGVLVFLERRMAKSRWGSLIDKLLEPYKKQSLLVMRIGIAATLLLAWDEDAMLMPELRVPAEWIGWGQFVVVLLFTVSRDGQNRRRRPRFSLSTRHRVLRSTAHAGLRILGGSCLVFFLCFVAFGEVARHRSTSSLRYHWLRALLGLA
jgi:hypothetical protein